MLPTRNDVLVLMQNKYHVTQQWRKITMETISRSDCRDYHRRTHCFNNVWRFICTRRFQYLPAKASIMLYLRASIDSTSSASIVLSSLSPRLRLPSFYFHWLSMTQYRTILSLTCFVHCLLRVGKSTVHRLRSPISFVSVDAWWNVCTFCFAHSHVPFTIASSYHIRLSALHQGMRGLQFR